MTEVQVKEKNVTEKTWTKADKRKAIRQTLLHPHGRYLSDRFIAKHVGVHHGTVGRIRRELEVTAEIPKSDSQTFPFLHAIETPKQEKKYGQHD